MPLGLISYALPGALATALVVAAFTDIRRREIDNGLNLAIAIAAPLWWLVSGYGWSAVAIQIGLAAVTFALGCLLFALRQMGGGDVKLLTALALWFAPESFLQLVVLMAILGGGASVAMAAFNMRRVPGETLRDGLAVLAALVWVGAIASVVFALVMHRPLVPAARIEAILTAIPSIWVLLALLLMAFAVIGVGLMHIMRRQKSRLPIPYGVAISAAGLWILGEHALRTAGQLTGNAGSLG
ncbi:prepilin peptidase [Novosphingobium sp. 9]|uniref:A24 family peptidase n=1 Tax=Novosphingobium sp. 9 TaxID=2025349 RepID=UPI0021B5D61B|nr:prepilin peptidase [Novosphingobium sp. 9]